MRVVPPKVFVFAGVILGSASGWATLEITWLSNLSESTVAAALQITTSALMMPGLLFSAAVSLIVSQNLHDSLLWLAAVSNLLFYLGLCWAIGLSIEKQRHLDTNHSEPSHALQ